MKTFISVLLSLIIVSCGSKQEEKPTEASQSFAVQRDSFFNGLQDIQATSELVSELGGFDSTLLNDPQLFYKYMDTDVKAASNLGIYLSDLNYCILFKHSQTAKGYFNAASELSKMVGIEKNTLDFLMHRYTKNIERNDSVKSVMNQLMNNATALQKGTDRERVAGISMIAYQIENLHLVLASLESLPETLTKDQIQSEAGLIQYILNQQGKFEITYNFIQSFTDPMDPNQNPNYPFFDNAFRELISAYRELPQNEQDKLLLKRDNPLLKNIGSKVNAIRSEIIVGQL
jgi:hypothetical protein